MPATTPDDAAWPLGDYLRNARELRALSVREAARRAGFAPSTWTTLETGRRGTGAGGHTRFRTPSADHVIKAAHAVEADPREALRLAGYDPDRFADDLIAAPRNITLGEIGAKLAQLTDAQRSAVIQLLNSLVKPSATPRERWGIVLDTSMPASGTADSEAAAEERADGR